MTIRYMVSIGSADFLLFDAERKPLTAVEPVIGLIRERVEMQGPEQAIDASSCEWDEALKIYSAKERRNARIYEAKGGSSVCTASLPSRCTSTHC